MSTATIALNGFSSTLSRAWTWGRRILWTGAAAVAAVVALEILHLHDLLSRIHPALAWTVSVLLAGLILFWAARYAARYLRTPRAVVPPDLPSPDLGWSVGERRAYQAFAARYLRRQLLNPHLPPESGARIPAALEAIGAPLAPEDEASPIRAAAALHARVEREISGVIAPLDVRANRLIRRAAVEVALATAVSPSVLLDSLITFTRNVNLISMLADLYYGRPGLAGTLRVLRDVLGSAAAAGALEIVSDHLSSALAEMTGAWSTRLIGPVGQGTINGVVTMRIGAAARLRCRSLATRSVPWLPWRLSDYRQASAALMRWLAEDVGPGVLGPLGRMARWSGKATRDTVAGGARVFREMWEWWTGPDAGEEETRAQPDSAAPRGDPLFESGLID